MVLLLRDPAALAIWYGGLIKSRPGKPTFFPLVDARFTERFDPEGWKSDGNPGKGRGFDRTGGGEGGKSFSIA